jgi:hypothetical protein
MAGQAKLPYVTAYGNITKALEKIQQASTPPRFTHDFLATKLGLSGGSARPVVPFLKRIGFIGTDGAPTELYKQFRGTDSQRGVAAAQGLRRGYAPLYVINEYAHEITDEAKLRALIVQATGEEKDSQAVKLIAKSFKALDAFADHDASDQHDDGADGGKDDDEVLKEESDASGSLGGLGLNYTINLQLPATSDIAVFNAIFKSLREHLLK